jgi:hypothetical protein
VTSPNRSPASNHQSTASPSPCLRPGDRARCSIAGYEIPGESGTTLFIKQLTEGIVIGLGGGIVEMRFDGFNRNVRLPRSHVEPVTSPEPLPAFHHE